jgi:hypothetical protein
MSHVICKWSHEFINFNTNTEYIMSNNREKFVELAEKRVQKTIKSMRLIGNLSNKTNYSYEDADLKKIFTTLRRELDMVKKKFDTSSSDDNIRFSL